MTLCFDKVHQLDVKQLLLFRPLGRLLIILSLGGVRNIVMSMFV